MPELYDLILVVSFFRRLSSYLSILKYLANEYRIGLLPVPIDERLRQKNKKAQDEFMKYCHDLGGKSIVDYPANAKVCVVPQELYMEEAYAYIRKHLRCTRRLGLLSFAWAGLHDRFINELDIKKVFVIDKAFLDFLLQHRGDPEVYKRLELVEIGLPFAKYPIFPKFECDYILAMPTPFSFPHEKDKWNFLQTVLALFKNISPDDEIVHKPHNAQEHDYFSTRKYRMLARSFKALPESVLVKRTSENFQTSEGKPMQKKN
jgi:hypothetical protein